LWTNHQGPIFVYTILYTIASLAMIIVKWWGILWLVA
jgi:hypothetical protein